MIIDCDTCAVRDLACGDCVVSVLLGTPEVPAPAADARAPAAPGDPLPAEFGPTELRALDVLADHGMIPRLRLVPGSPATDRAQAPSRGPRAGRDRRSAG